MLKLGPTNHKGQIEWHNRKVVQVHHTLISYFNLKNFKVSPYTKELLEHNIRQGGNFNST